MQGLVKHQRVARGYKLLFCAAVLTGALGACGNDVGAPPESIAPKAGNGGAASTAGTPSSGGKNVVVPDGGASGDAAGAGGDESMAGANGNGAGTSSSGGHSGSGGVAGNAGNGGVAGNADNGGVAGSGSSGGVAGTAGSGGVAGSGGIAGGGGVAGSGGMAGSAGTAGNGGMAGTAGHAGSGGTAGGGAICGDGVVVGDECEEVSTPLCSDDCRKVATQGCVDCELLSPCAEFSNNCVDWTSSPADQAICYDVQACIRATGCGNGTNTFTSCFCGALSTPSCQSAPDSGAGSPSGACAPVIRQAMLAPGETSITNQQVLERLLDVAYPGGAAISRWNCDKVKCKTECDFN